MLCYGVLIVLCVYLFMLSLMYHLCHLYNGPYFICLSHDKFEIGVINAYQPPKALLFDSRWAPKRQTTALKSLRLILMTSSDNATYSDTYTTFKQHRKQTSFVPVYRLKINNIVI